MLLAANGTVSFIRVDGTEAFFGTWECQGRALTLTPGATMVKAARASNLEINPLDYFFPVIYADPHELVMAPGMSVAGRLRFTR